MKPQRLTLLLFVILVLCIYWLIRTRREVLNGRPDFRSLPEEITPERRIKFRSSPQRERLNPEIWA